MKFLLFTALAIGLLIADWSIIFAGTPPLPME
jgi:hypothetical protein